MIITQPALIYPNPLDVIPIQVINIPLAPWNMRTSNISNVNIDFVYEEIFMVQAFIKNDSGNRLYTVAGAATAAYNAQISFRIYDAGIIELARSTGTIYEVAGQFERVDISRGYLSILRKVVQ